VSISQTPAYNLKVVLKETGIAADTLRAWERRYGLPRPERTPGGHRLYSQHDIQLIRWLMARQAEGLSISRAVEQWKESVASGLDPLAQERAGALTNLPTAPGFATSLDLLRSQWLSACLVYNEALAELVLNQAFALFPVEQVTQELIQRGLYEVGQMWQRGEASVQQEHYISALAARRLDALIAATPTPLRPQTILLACPPDEWHALPLLLLSLLLRRHGWHVVYLGANVPFTRLAESIDIVRPALVLMATQHLMGAVRLRNAATLLADKQIRFAFGGRIFNQIPELRKQIDGEFLGEDMQLVPARLEQLLEEAPSVHAGRQGGVEPRPVAEAYRLNRKLIESAIERQFAGAGPLEDNIATANLHFGNALEAALELGNIRYLEDDLVWIKGLLVAYDLPVETLGRYLMAYAQAVRQVAGTGAGEVPDALEAYATKS